MTHEADRAAEAVGAGRLIAFPTETVWSLSCRVDDPAVAEAVRAVKRRPGDLPLAVGYAHWADALADIAATPGAIALAEAFLPGPLSIICAHPSGRHAHLTPGHGTLSVRVPDHPVATAILERAGPLVMTSANHHGEPDPITRTDVEAALAGDPVTFFGGGPVSGTASTIVDATGDQPRVLREGVISEAEVAAAWP